MTVMNKLHSVDLMECGRFKARLMKTNKLTGDCVHHLPPGVAMQVYPIETLPGCPDNWIRASGSYVCPVDEHAMWFNWTNNDHLNTAILPSVRGMNPITGEKLEGFGLRSYVEKCPTHDIPFVNGSKRFCEKCDYEWPPQSYICAPNTLWWDGFRQPDGTVRQFFFSEDEARDIASAVIGKENTVPAFGFAFYEPVKRRESPPIQFTHILKPYFHSGVSAQSLHFGSGGGVGYGSAGNDNMKYVGHDNDSMKYMSSLGANLTPPNVMLCSCDSKGDGLGSSVNSFSEELDDVRVANMTQRVIDEKKEVAVGAGARIHQNLLSDTLNVNDWQIKPSAVMRLYFVFHEEFKQIVSKGTRDIVGSNEGFLKGHPVG
jgi:hypothetical protein